MLVLLTATKRTKTYFEQVLTSVNFLHAFTTRRTESDLLFSKYISKVDKYVLKTILKFEKFDTIFLSQTF